MVKVDTCDSALPPGDFCAVATGISSGVAYACIATAGSIGNLRGAMTIEETAPDGFGGSYQRPIRSAPLQ